jgi:hypothetical protein
MSVNYVIAMIGLWADVFGSTDTVLHQAFLSDRFRACLPAWRRGHRLQAGGRHLSIRSVPDLDQGPQTRQHAVQWERSENWNR